MFNDLTFTIITRKLYKFFGISRTVAGSEKYINTYGNCIITICCLTSMIVSYYIQRNVQTLSRSGAPTQSTTSTTFNLTEDLERLQEHYVFHSWKIVLGLGLQ